MVGWCVMGRITMKAESIDLSSVLNCILCEQNERD